MEYATFLEDVAAQAHPSASHELRQRLAAVSPEVCASTVGINFPPQRFAMYNSNNYLVIQKNVFAFSKEVCVAAVLLCRARACVGASATISIRMCACPLVCVCQ